MNVEKKQGFREVIEAAATETRQLNSLPYDGVMGALPAWMPEPLKREFDETRSSLLAEHTREEVKKYFEWRRALSEATTKAPGLIGAGSVPPSARSLVDALLYIHTIAKLGKERGLAAYLGEGASCVYRGIVHSEKQRNAARNPRGDALTKLIIKILRDNPRASEADVLAALEKDADQSLEKRVIDNVTGDLIEWNDSDGTAKETDLSALKHRISRARKKAHL